MRVVGPLAAAVIALGSLTACDTIQGVSDTADKVKLCADAISADSLLTPKRGLPRA